VSQLDRSRPHGICCAAAFILSLANHLPAQTSAPSCPPDWRIELVAEAPTIKHPSVVACAPDGRVFVAEDPMDISTARADEMKGRILCHHPDGRWTVFAEQLHAVFGMQYLEGKLYVMHSPKFSVFRDDNSVGRDREDLIEQTNPNPWALDWNDHVPANFKLAMDGYFYIAVGDKGLYGAVDRSGKRVDLHGGGVVRIRPDGTGLEVFCTGVRNIMDVAINAEDEIFTYDNTDEQQWMSRLTHMVDGGFYGYPYDFIPRRPYTLWCMADYGPGAATGTFCYNEDALPPEYHGNLFLADFGKRQLLRVRIERDGATYRVVSTQEFFRDPPQASRMERRMVGLPSGEGDAPAKTVEWEGTPIVLDSLRAALNDPNAFLRRVAMEGIREANDLSTPLKLRVLLTRERAQEARRDILQTLGSLRDPESAPLIARVLTSSEEPVEVRAEAVRAAEQIGGDELVGALIRLLGLPLPPLVSFARPSRPWAV
jgi:glucose/arabinose dehydrogenase